MSSKESGERSGSSIAMVRRQIQADREELDRLRESYGEKCQQADALTEVNEEIARTADVLSNRVKVLEEENVLLEDKLQSTGEKLVEAERTIEEHERFKKYQQEQERLSDSMIVILENQVKSVTISKEETERKYEELIHNFEISESKLQKSEELLAVTEVKLKTCDEELNALKENLKLVELNDEKNAEQKDQHELMMKKLHCRLKENECTIDMLSRQLQYKQAELSKMEESLFQSQLQYRVLREELDSGLRDLTSMFSLVNKD